MIGTVVSYSIGKANVEFGIVANVEDGKYIIDRCVMRGVTIYRTGKQITRKVTKCWTRDNWVKIGN